MLWRGQRCCLVLLLASDKVCVFGVTCSAFRGVPFRVDAFVV